MEPARRSAIQSRLPLWGAWSATRRTTANACLIGSVKTNIGHLEAGSGIAGLIKAALILHKEQIPPNQNFTAPNPQIPFDELGLRIVSRLQAVAQTGRG